MIAGSSTQLLLPPEPEFRALQNIKSKMTSKAQEALMHMNTAEKSLKTNLIRWKPDYEGAAEAYNRAAICYRAAQDVRSAKEAFMKSAECYRHNKSMYHAAKAMESAMLVNKELCTSEEVFNLALEASSLYQQHGSGDSAAGLLSKAARIIEEETPHLAVKLYQHAADVSIAESSQHQGIEYVAKAARLFIRLLRYDEAVDCLRREIGLNFESNNTKAIGRLCVAVVLVQIARGDIIAAEKIFKEWGVYCEMSEVNMLEQLLQAYDEEDRESARHALNSPFIKNMDVEYARLAATLPLPEAGDMMPRVGIRENAAASYVSPNAPGAGGPSSAAHEYYPRASVPDL